MPVMRLKQQVGRCGSKPAVFPFPPGGGVMRGGREFPPGIDRCGLVPLPCRLPLKGGVMGAALAQTASPVCLPVLRTLACAQRACLCVARRQASRQAGGRPLRGRSSKVKPSSTHLFRHFCMCICEIDH